MKNDKEIDNQTICFMILYLVPSIKAGEYIPSPLEVVNILPAYTAGGFYISCSMKDSKNVNEFSFLPAYTQYKGKKGFYCSPIDISKGLGPLHSDDSFFPAIKKEGSSFYFEVSLNGKQILSLKVRPKLKKIPVRINYPFLVLKGSGLVFYRLNCTSNFTFSTSDVKIPYGSPFYDYPFKLKIISGMWESNKILVNEPVPILGKRAPAQLRNGAFGKRANNFRKVNIIS